MDSKRREAGRQQSEPQVCLHSTIELLEQARAGDSDAVNLIFERYRAPLRRWAAGRLPSSARQLLDTDDIVQETLLNTLHHVTRFEYRHEGALHGYLRRALGNRIKDELRRVKHELQVTQREAADPASFEDSPLTRLIGRETEEQYERALERLRPEDREIVLARVELAMSYQQIAQAFGKRSADAARMAVARALLRLASEMTG